MSGLGVVALQPGAQMGSPIESALVFVVNLLIGAAAIHVGARFVVGEGVDYGRAVFTALVGAVVWAVVAFFFGWIPLLGPLLALVAWIGVINWRYPGGWVSAATIGLIAWIVAVVVLYVLAAAGLFELSALGVPGA